MSHWIPIYVTLNTYGKHLHFLRHTRSAPPNCDTHTHTQTESLTAQGLSQSKYWHVVTGTGREMYTASTQRETHCMKYLSTGGEWNGERREVLTVARSPEKWSRRWRKWIKVIGCNKEEVKKRKKKKRETLFKRPQGRCDNMSALLPIWGANRGLF